MTVFYFKDAGECYNTTFSWQQLGFNLDKVSNVTVEGSDFVCREYSRRSLMEQAVTDVATTSLREVRQALYPVVTRPEASFAEDYLGEEGDELSISSMFSSSVYSEESLDSIDSIEIAPFIVGNVPEPLFNEVKEEFPKDIPREEKYSESCEIEDLLRDSFIQARITLDKETGHEYVVLEDSSFIFIPKGDRSKAQKIRVWFAESGERVANPNDLKHMILCYCSVYSSAQSDWVDVKAPGFLAKLGVESGAEGLNYTLMLINFQSQDVIVYSNPSKKKGFGIFSGTKLAIERSAVKRIQDIDAERRKDFLKSKGHKLEED